MLHRKYMLLLIFILFSASIIILFCTNNQELYYEQTINHEFIRREIYSSSNNIQLSKNDGVRQLLQKEKRLFIIEPHLLMLSLSLKDNYDLVKRYSLPNVVDIATNSDRQPTWLTLGIFHDDISKSLIDLSKELHSMSSNGYSTQINHKNDKISNKNIAHMFIELNNRTNIHIVVFHKRNNYLLIGEVDRQKTLLSPKPISPFFVNYRSIYEVFELIPTEHYFFGNILSIDDPFNFLSQLSTARFMSCTPESKYWLKNNNHSENQKRVQSSIKALKKAKSVMKEMRMQGWIICGTLLGWYRQCGITPYTSDTDIASHSYYLNGELLDDILKPAAAKYDMKVYQRFGEPSTNLEYTLNYKGEKVDLFFAYNNHTNYLVSVHTEKSFRYLVYPKYDLCSIVLLNEILLAPCNPEEVLVAEYGKDWRKPVDKWNYWTSSKNLGPIMKQSNNSKHIIY